MEISKTLWFFVVQTLVWSGLALVTRFTWIAPECVPPWTNLLLYSAMGFVVSSGLGAVFLKLSNRSAIKQLIGAAALTLAAALLWRGTYNAFEFHILETANNTFEFWGYFHYGRMSTFQLSVWSAIFWMLHYYARAQTAAGTAGKVTPEQTPRTSDLLNGSDPQGQTRPQGIAVKDGNTTRWIDPMTIESIVSAKDYLCIKVDEEILVHRATMKGLSQTLPEYFIRCHRSHIVNVKFIATFKANEDQTSIYTTSGSTHPVSRRYKADVKSRLSAQAL